MVPYILFLWKNGIFHALADSELQCCLGWYLDGFAGRGVSAFSGFSLGFYELAESGEYELAVDFTSREARL